MVTFGQHPSDTTCLIVREIRTEPANAETND